MAAPEPSSPDVLEVLSRLCALTAEELVGPLSGLLPTLQFLAEQPLDAKTARMIQRSLRLTERMLETVEDLRVFTGAAQCALSKVDLSYLVGEILAALELPEQYRVTLELRALAPVVEGDSRLLSKALRNLLRNSVRLMPDGGTIVIRIEEHEDTLRLSVSDDGPGLSPSARALLFERASGGFGEGGLGLFLVHAIVEQIHLGRFSYAPNEPRGSRFDLSFPLSPSRPPAGGSAA